ncbi:hypothetical protein [Phycicoccus jejuensis]|uniref:hypothetical protein n=1 Tax=Phycicoccus jejuensis TaxID=367299 RepID=UPI0004C46689|nr:hypothetical protein [Phycicoccus jejuensis]
MDAETPAQASPDEHGLLALSLVAELIGRDISTVKRWLREGRWAGAVQDASGRRAWRVPFSSLVEAGDVSAPEVAAAQVVIQLSREPKEMHALRVELARTQERLRAAEALARERAEMIALLRSVMALDS